MYRQDDENTFMYKPVDMHGNRFFGSWSRLYTLDRSLNEEVREKYTNDYAAGLNAQLELGGMTDCFDYCIQDVNTGSLNSGEKNCMRECYMKRINSRDEVALLAT